MLGTNRSLLGGAVLLVAACGPTANPTGESPGPGPNPAQTDAGNLTGDGPDAGNCGAQQESIELVNLGDPPDMLIVLDRSGSMDLAPGINPFGTSKWSIMKDALGGLVEAKQDNIRFGLAVFPTDDACGVSPGTEVPVDLGNAAAIEDWLSDNDPTGNTPAHQSLGEALSTFNGMPVNPEGRYVLFATDGVPNCNPTVDDDGGDATIAAVQALHDAGIDTFVLGFGSVLSLDSGVLNDAAQAGGHPKPSSPYYYQADDAQQLTDALDEIAGGIITPSCSYQLTDMPPDPDLVTVTADGVAVPRSPSHGDGWDYAPDDSTITFFGSYCTNIESGAISSVDFVFGCPGPITQ